MLSDLDATTVITLDTDQMVGNKSIWFNTTLADVPDKYWAGNRLYAEFGWDTKLSPPNAKKTVMDRRFYDSPEYQGKGTNVKESNTTTILLAVFIPLGFVYVPFTFRSAFELTVLF